MKKSISSRTLGGFSKMNGMKCSCGAQAKYVEKLRFNKNLIDGWVCLACGETYYNPEQAEKILLLNKIRRTMYHIKLNKVKSNLILRIPKEVGDALNLCEGEQVQLGLKEGKKIIVQPL